MEAYRTDRARPGEGKAVADFFRLIPSPEVAPLTIWHSPLAGNYAEDVIRGACMPQLAFFVLRYGESIGAAISYRFFEGRAMVDEVFVTPRLRRLGLTRSFIADSLRFFVQEHPSLSVAWSFFVPQPGLEEWYRTLGAINEGTRHFWVGPLPASDSGKYRQTRCEHLLAKADEQHALWGFSSIVVQTSKRTYNVGRLHAPYFRLTDESASDDEELASALAALDATRMMVLMTDGEIHGKHWKRVASMVRVKASVETVLHSLSN